MEISWFGKIIEDLKTAEASPSFVDIIEPVGEGEEVIDDVDEMSKKLFMLSEKCIRQLLDLIPSADKPINSPSDLRAIVKMHNSIKEEAKILQELAWFNLNKTLNDVLDDETKAKIDGARSIAIRQGWKVVVVHEQDDEPKGIPQSIKDLFELFGFPCIVIGRCTGEKN